MRPWGPSGASLDVVAGKAGQACEPDRPAWEQQGAHSVGVWWEDEFDGLGMYHTQGD